MAEHEPGVILATGPPFSFLASGQRLAERTGLPLILEFRDAWFTGMYWPYRNRWRRAAARRWERRCVQAAARIITVTDAYSKILIDAYGPEMGDKIQTIRHGFAPANGRDQGPEAIKPDEGVFTLAYTGQVRGIDIVSASRFRRAIQWVGHGMLRLAVGARFCEKLRVEWMSPHYLLEALAQVAREEASFWRQLRLVFVGQRFAEIDAWAQKWGLGENVVQKGPVTPASAQQLAREARDLAMRAGTGVSAPPDDVVAIADQVRRLYAAHTQRNELIHPEWEFIERFEAAKQVALFERLVNEVLEG